jgi:2-dehydropantoate 2-reductase
MVIVLQNGLGLEADIQAIVPHATIIGGLCFLCSNKVGPGHIKHIDFGTIRLGEYHPEGPAGITDNLRDISQAFEAAGIPIVLSDNLEKARWEKLVWNISYNGLSAILNATTDQIMSCPSTLKLVREIMLEVIQAAGACGYDLSENFVDEMLETTQSMAKYSPSMKLDSENKRALEIEKIYWQPIQTARKAGIEMHRSRLIALQLEFIDQQNRL